MGIDTLLRIFNAGWTAIKNVLGLFGIGSAAQAKSENTQAVEVANASGEISGAQTRASEKQVNQELATNDQQTESDVARVRDASSVRDENAALAESIARSRSHARADD